jgi:hypothetical protein
VTYSAPPRSRAPAEREPFGGSISASVHFGGSNPACVHFGGSAGYDVSGSGCQTTSSSSEPQFTWGISRIRSFWFRMQNQFQYFRAASFNPFVSTTTPPYYSLTTYHLRQIYASTVALKTALKIVPLNYRCAKMNTPQHRRRWLRRLTPTSNTYEQIGTITVQLYRYVY